MVVLRRGVIWTTCVSVSTMTLTAVLGVEPVQQAQHEHLPTCRALAMTCWNECIWDCVPSTRRGSSPNW